MSVLNYSTKVPAARTISEMQAMLAANGASRIAVDYADGTPSGLTFTLPTAHGVRLFSLPVDVDAMHRLLVAEDEAGRLASGTKATRSSLAQAERVAWRVVKDWLAAQLALVATKMAAVDQVLLPYLHVDADHTLYQAYREREDALELH